LPALGRPTKQQNPERNVIALSSRTSGRAFAPGFGPPLNLSGWDGRA